jgi:tRNA(fMet)-specific endonuclease VapC
MKNVLIDTSIIIDYLRLENNDKSKTPLVKVTQRFSQFSISIITYFESYAGKSIWEKSEAKLTLEKLLAGMKVVGLDTATAEKAGELRARYNMSTMDALIAATALQHGLPLATLNLKHFEAVPELQLLSDRKEAA